MKLNYRNFTRLGANSKGTSFVPEKFVRKPGILQTLEKLQLVIAIGFLVSVFSVTLDFYGLVAIAACIALGFSSVFLATDNHLYKSAGNIAGFLGLIAMLITFVGYGFNWLSLSVSFILVFCAAVTNLNTRVNEYFNWAKSVGE